MSENARRRTTPQRTAILDVLRRSCSHPTAAEIHGQVRSVLPRISLGTVYRNLDVLAAEGLIRRLDLGSNEARFDATLTPHDHARCTGCGGVFDVPADALPGRLPGDLAGFTVRERRVEYVGLCESCAGDGAADPRAH